METPSSVTVSLAQRVERNGTFTNITASWTDPHSCEGNYYVRVFNAQDVLVRTLGSTSALQITTLVANTGILWDTVAKSDWVVRVTCTPTSGSQRVVGDATVQFGVPSS